MLAVDGGKALGMVRILKWVGLVLAVMTACLVGYGAKGYFDAMRDADGLRDRAERLLEAGRGGEDLGDERLEDLLRVQDPAYFEHGGVDFTTAGAGATTVSQSVSKRLAFERFRPGIGKVRQTGYALGLESHLDKDQILALWLDTLEMGRGPDGWMTGFHHASEQVFGASPAEIERGDFLRMAAVLIAPGQYDLRADDPALAERVGRIERLLAGECVPLDHGDVWLEGCGSALQ